MIDIHPAKSVGEILFARRDRRLWLDLVLAVAVFITGCIIGAEYYASFVEDGGRPIFPHRWFAPAVSMGCGRGFAGARAELDTPLHNFLRNPHQFDEFDCKDLPAQSVTLGTYEKATRYLLRAVGLTWLLLGSVSWIGLAPLFGVLFGISAVCCYGIFRLGMGRLLSVFGCFLLLFSGMQLMHLPHLRDYAKAPFILALVWIVGVLVSRPFKPRWLLALSALGGLVLGLGFGFRTDLFMIFVPLVLGILFVPGGILNNKRLKLASLVLFAVVALILSWPVMSGVGDANGVGHVILLGLMQPYDDVLKVNASVYDWGKHNSDYYAYSLINARQYSFNDSGVAVRSELYGTAGMSYLFEIIKYFPADILTRAYASVVNVLNLSFRTLEWQSLTINVGNIGGPQYMTITGGLIHSIANWRDHLLNTWVPMGMLAMIVALVIVCSRDLRIALFLFFLVLYCLGYPAMQHSPRHLFYWEFVGLWAVGFVIQAVGQFGYRMVHSVERRRLWERLSSPRTWWTPATQRSLTFIVLSLVVILIPPLLLRQYQQSSLTKLLDSYLDADRAELDITYSQLTNGNTLVSSPQLLPEVLGPYRESIETGAVSYKSDFRPEYLILKFDGSQCNAPSQIPFAVLYETHSSGAGMSMTRNFSYRDSIDVPDNVSYVFFPIPYTYASHFAGIQILPSYAACLESMYKVRDISDIPLPLYFVVGEDWELSPLYQRLSFLDELSYHGGKTYLSVSKPDVELLTDSSALNARGRWQWEQEHLVGFEVTGPDAGLKFYQWFPKGAQPPVAESLSHVIGRVWRREFDSVQFDKKDAALDWMFNAEQVQQLEKGETFTLESPYGTFDYRLGEDDALRVTYVSDNEHNQETGKRVTQFEVDFRTNGECLTLAGAEGERGPVVCPGDIILARARVRHSGGVAAPTEWSVEDRVEGLWEGSGTLAAGNLEWQEYAAARHIRSRSDILYVGINYKPEGAGDWLELKDIRIYVAHGALWWEQEGYSRYAQGEFEAAIEAFEQSIEQDDARSSSCASLAAIRGLPLSYYAMGRYQEAMESIQAWVHEEPQSCMANRLLGLIEVRLDQDLPEAIDGLERVLASSDCEMSEYELAESYAALGRAYCHTGQRDECGVAYRQADAFLRVVAQAGGSAFFPDFLELAGKDYLEVLDYRVHSIPFDWRGPEEIGVDDLYTAAPPLGVQGHRGQFSVSWQTSEEGDVLHISSIPSRVSEGSRVVQFGIRAGDDLVVHGGDAVLVVLEARFSQPEGTAGLFIQDRTDEWERTSVPTAGATWQRYAVARPIRVGADEIWLGLVWKPHEPGEWLEVRDVEVIVSTAH